MPKTDRKTNRAPQGAGGICKRSDGRWQGSYTVGTDPGTGKPVKKYVYGKTEGECVKKLKALQSAIDNGTFIEPSRMTVAQWLDIWTAEYLGGVKNSTEHAYKAHIKNHIKPALVAVKLQKLNPHSIQAFYNSLQRDKGLSPKTIKNLHGVLHSALKQAVAVGYIRQNPADNATLPRCDRPEVQTLPEDALPLFLEAITGHEFEAIYFITLFTGLRQGEVLGLSWPCIDFDRGTVLIKQQLQRERGSSGTYTLISTKSNKPRTISPAPDVMKMLRHVRAQQAKRRLRAGAAWSNPDNLVFTDALGKHLVPDTVYAHFKRIVSAIGCPDLRFHDLRHTYAVNALQAGDNIKEVQDNLGHHTAAFTLDTYGHVTERMKRDSADRMQRLIEEAKKRRSS
jgi:integrase